MKWINEHLIYAVGVAALAILTFGPFSTLSLGVISPSLQGVRVRDIITLLILIYLLLKQVIKAARGDE